MNARKADAGDGRAVPAKRRRLNTRDVFVRTPFGYRPVEHIHRVRRDETVEIREGTLLKARRNRLAVLGTLPDPVPAGLSQPPSNGWVASCEWTNVGRTPIATFSTTWTVPDAPRVISEPKEQSIYLFSGIQDDVRRSILQPVLQWGPADVGGGPYWAISSWYYVGDGGHTVLSDSVRVESGQSVTGMIRLTALADGSATYTCAFTGYEATSLTITTAKPLLRCCEALESYGVATRDEYPAAARTSMEQIRITLHDGTTPSVSWSPTGWPARLGETATVVTDGARGDGRIDLAY